MKTILITGSTDGIGLQTAIELAKLNHKIIVHGRSEAKCGAAVRKITTALSNAETDFFVADFSSLKQVYDMSEAIKKKYSSLAVLINNAGVYMNNLALSVEGYELSFAVNHLAHFLLTNRLLPLLKNSPQGRIIMVSSGAHFHAIIDFDNLRGEKAYSAYPVYAQSKLANVLFSNHLAKQLHINITSNALHPGVITTKMLKQGFGISGASLKEGAATSVYLADAKEVENISGKYFTHSRVAASSNAANDPQLQMKLWELSETFVKNYLTNQ